MALHQRCRSIHLTSREKMVQRFLNQPLACEPLASTAMQVGQTCRRDLTLSELTPDSRNAKLYVALRVFPILTFT
jgi:hypothetical protein